MRQCRGDWRRQAAAARPTGGSASLTVANFDTEALSSEIIGIVRSATVGSAGRAVGEAAILCRCTSPPPLSPPPAPPFPAARLPTDISGPRGQRRAFAPSPAITLSLRDQVGMHTGGTGCGVREMKARGLHPPEAAAAFGRFKALAGDFDRLAWYLHKAWRRCDGFNTCSDRAPAGLSVFAFRGRRWIPSR